MIDSNLLIYLTFLGFVFLWKMFSRRVLSKKYMNLRNQNNWPSEIKIRVSISFYKLQYNILLFCFLLASIYKEKWIWNRSDFISTDPIPMKYKLIYLMEMAFYTVEQISLVFEPRKKDFIAISIHHCVTILILIISFCSSYYRHGILILLCHNISDPLLEISKIENYFKNTIVSTIGFIIFASVFMIARLIVYPFLCYTIFNQLLERELRIREIIILFILLTLQILHIFWTKYIIALAIRILQNQKIKDPRETA